MGSPVHTSSYVAADMAERLLTRNEGEGEIDPQFIIESLQPPAAEPHNTRVSSSLIKSLLLSLECCGGCLSQTHLMGIFLQDLELPALLPWHKCAEYSHERM